MKHKLPIVSGSAILFLASISGCSSQSPNGGGAHLPNVLWSPNNVSWSGGQTEEIEDPALNETAFRVNVPSGWKFVGAMLRPSGCHRPSVPADGISYTVLAPDGYTAVGQLPGVSWGWTSDGSNPPGSNCAPIGIDTAAGFLLNIAVPNIHPDATNVRIVPLPAKAVQMLAAAQRSAMGSQNFHRLIDSAQVRFEYNLGDQAIESQFLAILDCAVVDTPAYPILHRAALRRRNCSVHGTVFRHAPKGQLDALLATNPPPPVIDHQWDQQVIQSMQAAFAQYQKASDEQFRSIQQHFAQQTAAMLRRGRDFQASQRSSFDHAMAADRANQNAIDHAAHLSVLDSLNRQDFIDPSSGKKVEMSNQYTHNWISSDKNAIFASNDPTFDPNGVVDPIRQSWTELIPAN